MLVGTGKMNFLFLDEHGSLNCIPRPHRENWENYNDWHKQQKDKNKIFK